MPFFDLLDKNNVCIDPTAQSKTGVLLKVSHILSHNHPELDLDMLFDAYWKREAMGSTAIGHGIIIPHIRSETIQKTCACLIKLLNPVDFGAEDKQPIDLVLGLVVSHHQAEEHLLMLKEIINHFNIPLFRKACRNASDAETLYKIVTMKSPATLREKVEVAELL